VLALHVGFVDTDLARSLDVPKLAPAEVAALTLDALAAGEDEILGDEGTRLVRQGLSRERPSYIDPEAR